ncbi:MAG: RNA-binding protein [Hyphomicrobiales bacterium]
MAELDEDSPEVAERTCIVTREVHEPDALIRFARAPDGTVVPDVRGKLPGRGVWVGARRTLVETAAKKHLFSRGFKAEAKAPADLASQTGDLLSEAALSLLALANKAGLAVTGFEKVAERARHGRVAVLVEACDGAADGRRKIAAAAASSGGTTEVVEVFTSAQLGLAFGLPSVVHAAVAEGGLARSFLAAARRFERYEAA